MKAYELLEQKGWCKGAMARDAEGGVAAFNSSKAVSFCAIGAIRACYTSHYDECYRLSARLNSGNVVGWNDNPARTKEEVVAVLKELDI